MTSLAPILQASPAIQIHVAAAVLALLLGPLALYRQRRDRLHRVVGYVWIIAMMLTALSSFWVHSMPLIGPFGPIHALSLWTLFALVRGLRAAIRGDIAVHRGTMRGIYHFGLAAAALFTLLPGRIMHRVLFGADSKAGLVALAALLLAVAAAVLLQRRYGPRRNA
jgi:uncharacterized membrane protein